MTDRLDCAAIATHAGLSSEQLKALSVVAVEAARKGGSRLMEHFGKLTTIQEKGRSGDLVTAADHAAEATVLEVLSQSTPDIAVLAEESGASDHVADLCWCVDPLDGTTNFAHSYPLFATSIGLVWRNKPVLGAISVPFLKELYWCCPGQGSFLNDKAIHVSDCSSLEDSLLVTGFAYDRRDVVDNNYAEFAWMTHRTRGVRRGGAAAVDLAFVAAGRLDGYWERGLAPWDLAAGAALVQLAGGAVGDYRGNGFNLSSGRILAAGTELHKTLQKELGKVSPMPPQQYEGTLDVGS